MYLYMTSWEHVRHSNLPYATAYSTRKFWQSCPYLSNATLQTPIHTEMLVQRVTVLETRRDGTHMHTLGVQVDSKLHYH
jgi:hypothetical protein